MVVGVRKVVPPPPPSIFPPYPIWGVAPGGAPAPGGRLSEANKSCAQYLKAQKGWPENISGYTWEHTWGSVSSASNDCISRIKYACGQEVTFCWRWNLSLNWCSRFIWLGSWPLKPWYVYLRFEFCLSETSPAYNLFSSFHATKNWKHWGTRIGKRRLKRYNWN